MLDEDLAGVLEADWPMLVGLVRPDGAPYASRAWGADVLDAAAGRIRVLVGADDLAEAEAAPGGTIAVTTAEVRSLQSAQVKGTIDAVATATDDQVRRALDHAHHTFERIEEVDGTPASVLLRIVPPTFVAVDMTVAEVYDQTPGPSAGRAVEPGR